MGINDHITKHGKNRSQDTTRPRQAVLPAPSPRAEQSELYVRTPDGVASGQAPAYDRQNASAAVDFALAAQLGLEDDGYLRILPDYPKRWHVYWTWRSGPHKNTYVYWSADWNCLSEGLHGILTKISWVRAGQLRPTPVSKDYQR